MQLSIQNPTFEPEEEGCPNKHCRTLFTYPSTRCIEVHSSTRGVLYWHRASLNRQKQETEQSHNAPYTPAHGRVWCGRTRSRPHRHPRPHRPRLRWRTSTLRRPPPPPQFPRRAEPGRRAGGGSRARLDAAAATFQAWAMQPSGEADVWGPRCVPSGFPVFCEEFDFRPFWNG